MTEAKFLALTLSGISQVYSGKRDCCRCGCGGEYTATSFMDVPRGSGGINDKLVEKRLARAKKLVKDGTDVMYGDNYVDVQTGNDRTLTFYVDELKKPEGTDEVKDQTPKRLIDLDNIMHQITHWKALCNGEVEYYNRKRCAMPETALKKAQAVFDGEITITGLFVHAETKPVLIQ